MGLRRRVALLVSVAALLAAGCAPSTMEPGPGGSPTPSDTGYGVRYELPPALCDATRLSAIREIYPDEELDHPLRLSTPTRCDAVFHKGTRGLGVNLFLIQQEDNLLQLEPTLTRQQYEGQRERATYPPTEVTGVGSGAFWYGDGNDEMWLESYDGNLNVRIYVFTLDNQDPLDPDMAGRLGAVATEIFADLAP